MVTNHELQRIPSFIKITLLPRLGCSEICLYYFYFFLSLDHQFGSKYLTFSSLGPTQRSLTPSTIQGLEWCHLQTGLIAVVIRKLSQGKTFVPVLVIMDDTCSKHILKKLIHPFGLSVSLWMVS